MDLRAPLPPEHCIAMPPKDEKNNTSSTIIVLEPSIKNLLNRMYLASQMLELGSESRFTCIILFRRYVGHFHKVMQKNWHQMQQRHQKGRKSAHDNDIQPSLQEMKQIKRHLGRIAAACLFLGCKTEEEPRRIRDVINLSIILDFEDVGGNSSTSAAATTDINNGDVNESKRPKLTHGQSPTKATTTEPLEIIESKHPPPLDEKYWSDKEQMVSTEQHLLRMLQFDTLVCHPYRCVLIVMDTLNFGKGTNCQNQTHSLLSPRASENLIFKAWTILNEISINASVLSKTVLRYNVVTLACAVISVSAAVNRSSNGGNEETLPDEWWRALDVPTNEFMSAAESVRNLLRETGRTTSCSIELP